MINKLLQNKIPEKEIMVLTPYRAHKDHIRELLSKESKVDVSTVHESQGWQLHHMISCDASYCCDRSRV